MYVCAFKSLYTLTCDFGDLSVFGTSFSPQAWTTQVVQVSKDHLEPVF
jgi:hypothetical protein